MSNPSLLCVPYRFKTSTLYSQIPDSGLGDFTVTRSASNAATRVNSAGRIETVLDNVPRLDYPLGGITAGCPALLVEPSAQNTCLQSSDFNTTWLALSSATVNPNTAISPDGTQNADTINLAAVNDSRVSQTITVANSTTYTISCFYKNIALTAGELFNMRFNNFLTAPNNFLATATIDLAAGTATYTIGGTAGTGFSGTATGRIENYGNGWYRVSMTFTVGSAGGNAGGFQTAHVGSATARSFYAWGAQLEASPVATSYIPTTTAAVTRGADVVSKTAVSSLIGQTEGTIYAEVAYSSIATTKTIISITDGTPNNRIAIRINATTIITARIVVAGTSSDYNVTIPAIPSSGILKISLAYKADDYVFAINGTIYASTTTRPVPATNAVILGNNGFGTDFLNDRIRAAALYTTRLTNAQLQSLTQ